MSTPQGFSKPEVKRALSAAQEAGLKISGVRFPPEGGFTILTSKLDDEGEGPNPWDEDD